MTSRDPGSPGTGKPEREDEPSARRRDDPVEDPGPPVTNDNDVSLEVPMLNIEELALEVEDLRAHISARAELVDFLNIGVGVDVYLDNVKLQVKGLEAQLQFKVKLERILGTIDRALDVMANDRRPPNRRGLEANRTEEGDTGVPDEAAAPENSSNLPMEDKYLGGNVMDPVRDGDNNRGKGLDDDENVVETEESGVRATTAARKKARSLGVDLGAIRGSGQAGRVLVRDVERAAR